MTTYATLVQDVAEFANREDLTAKIPTFIRLAEANLNRDIRSWRMENRAYLTTSNRYFALPEDWIETIRLTIEGDSYALEPLSTKQMAAMRGNRGDAGGTPRFFRHSENAIEVFPTGDGDNQFNLEYYQKIPALDDTDTTTNWLLTEHYDVYLYCVMLHLWNYLMDTEQTTVTAQIYAAAVSQVNKRANQSEFSGRNKRMRVNGLGGGNHQGLRR